MGMTAGTAVTLMAMADTTPKASVRATPTKGTAMIGTMTIVTMAIMMSTIVTYPDYGGDY